MKRKRYTKEKIISILKEHEADASIPDLSRHHDVAENTICYSPSKFNGMEVSDTKRVRTPEQGNRRLKHLLPRVRARQGCAQGVARGKVVTSAERR